MSRLATSAKSNSQPYPEVGGEQRCFSVPAWGSDMSSTKSSKVESKLSRGETVLKIPWHLEFMVV